MLGLCAYAYGILSPDQELIQAASHDELTMERLQSLIDQGARGNNIKALFAAIQEGRPVAVATLLTWSKKNALLVEPYPISAIDSLLNIVEEKTINISCCQLFTGPRWHSKITEMLVAYKEFLQSGIPNNRLESVVRYLVKNVLSNHPLINSLTTSIVTRLRSSQSHTNTYSYSDIVTTVHLFLRLFQQQEMLRNLRSSSMVSTQWATEITPIYAYKVINGQQVISEYRLYSQNLDPAHEQLEGLHPIQDPMHKDLLLLDPDIHTYRDYIHLLLNLHYEQELLSGHESFKLAQDDLEIRTAIENYIRQIFGPEISLPSDLHLNIDTFIVSDPATGIPFVASRPIAELLVMVMKYIHPHEAAQFLDLPIHRHIALNQDATLYDLLALKKAVRQRQFDYRRNALI